MRRLPYLNGIKAFEAAGPAGSDGLFTDLVALVGRYAGTTSGPVVIPSARWTSSATW